MRPIFLKSVGRSYILQRTHDSFTESTREV